MSLLRYPAYKDSGVEWLGEVPGHWGVRPFYSVANEREEPNIGMLEDNLLSLSYGRIVQKDITSNDGLLPESFETYQVVRSGDIVFRLTDLQNDKRSLRTAIVEETGIITSAYVAAVPISIVPQYLNYLLRTYDIQKVFYSMGGGLRQSMKFSDLKRLPTLLPPPEEQQTIAAFLDRETGKIDALITEQQHLVELLVEKRQAVISHAVTKGLNPNTTMKDSGIAWLSEVPEHWGVIPFKIGIEYQEGPGILASDFYGEGVPLLRVSCVQGRWATLDGCNYLDPEKVERQWNHFKLRPGDLLISASASMGTVCEVNETTEGAIHYTGLIRLRGKRGIMTRSFVRSLVISSLFSTQIDLLKAGSTIQHFGPTHLSQIKIVSPPIAEQEEIAEFIDRETAKLDALIAEANQAVALLQERKSALISTAVSGKIDVRFVPLNSLQSLS